LDIQRALAKNALFRAVAVKMDTWALTRACGTPEQEEE
jgi:hypothetical protein